MAGVESDEALLGWHGLIGDRRLGVRQINRAGDFPWLTSSRMPELLLYQPTDLDLEDPELVPQRVRSPSGELLDTYGKKLRMEIGGRADSPVELLALKHGIFDDAVVSLIGATTTSHICNEAGVRPDSRRFRANIEIDCDKPIPFAEDEWVGHTIAFGESSDPPVVAVTKRDLRCKMIGLDPDTAQHDPLVLKTAVRLNENYAGVYVTVIRTGTLRVGDSLHLMNDQIWRRARD